MVLRSGVRRGSRSRRSGGQALTEFALIVPIMLILLLGIADLSRIYATQLTIESAAREAADYGAYISSQWAGDPATKDTSSDKTVTAMTNRVCVASSKLTDFKGDSADCTNPTIEVSLVDKTGKRGDWAADCDKPARAPEPCRVRVDLDYTFNLISPFGIDFFGVRLGLPSSLTFTRTSIFAISDFQVDKQTP